MQVGVMETCCGVVDSSTKKLIIITLICTVLVCTIVVCLTTLDREFPIDDQFHFSLDEHGNKTDECATSPCHHGVLGVDHACICHAGWTGTYCNDTIDECVNNTNCRNGGTCVDQINSFVCHCATGWSGANCSVPEPDLLKTGICGTRAAAPQRRIVGGQSAPPGKWPWAAFMLQGNTIECGASLLNREWAVTAAHCKGDKLVFGDVSKNSDVTSNYRQESTFTSYCHADYNESEGIKYDNDICLLKLHTSVNYTDYVRPVCIGVSQHEPEYYSSQSCYVIGWGKVEAKGPKSNDLQEIEAKLINISDCQINKDIIVSNVYGRHLSENMICAASDDGQGLICNGDSGSSLACSDGNGVWHLVGVVSWKYGENHCGRLGYPDAQSRVSKYLDWIKNTTTFYSDDHVTL